MKRLSTTITLTWLFAVLAWLSTIVFMAGVAGLQYGCSNGFASVPLQKSSGATIAAFGMSSTFANCSTTLRFYWYTFAFVTVTLFSVMCATISRWGLHYARTFVTGLVTYCLVLMTIASEAFLGYEMVYDSFGLEYTWWHMRFRSACAGAIMTVVWLVFLLMAVGIDWERNSGVDERVADSKEAFGVAPVAAPIGTAAARV